MIDEKDKQKDEDNLSKNVVESTGNIRSVSLQDEMKRSYLDYAMSVIVSRALPDVRDGLKPVHRRILYAMFEDGNVYNRAYKKSAKVVGNVMGNYHPHSDAPIYEALVRLTQNFNLRLPLVDGQGNFGSIDGDPAAAARYTESRLARSAHDLLEDIDKDTVDFQPNYDDTSHEPKVLPARFPNLLVNGATGIAVGMATSIPTHNVGEVIDALIFLVEHMTQQEKRKENIEQNNNRESLEQEAIDQEDLDHEETDQNEITEEITVLDLMRFIKGPDFPTGGVILGNRGIMEAYRTGKGSVVVRGISHIEKHKNDRESIVITEIPYQVNKARMIEKIADSVREKTIEGISELRDESDRDGIRVVIELKRDAVSDVVLNQLYRYSQLQSSCNFNMLALYQGRPKQLSLLDILSAFVEFRHEVIYRRTSFLLGKSREKAHILLGFLVSILNLDAIIQLIRGSKDRAQAKEGLMECFWNASDEKEGSVASFLILLGDENEASSYRFSELQTNAILDLRLHRLTALEREKIDDELKDLSQKIEDYLKLLSSKFEIFDLLKTELLETKERFNTPRRTKIEDMHEDLDIDDLIQSEDMVITVSIEGYIKRVPLSTYRSQKRGGKGRSGMSTKETDVVADIFIANTHDHILFFSTLGKVYQLKVYKLPISSPQSKGRAMVNLLPLMDNEKISTVLILPRMEKGIEKGSDKGAEKEVKKDLSDEKIKSEEERYLIFATSFGNVRRNKIGDFASIPNQGKRAIGLDENEKLIGVVVTKETDDILLLTRKGICNRFNVTNIRVFSGRSSNGVRGIRLQELDEVISVAVLSQGKLDMKERVLYLKMANIKRYMENQESNSSVEECDIDSGVSVTQETVINGDECDTYEIQSSEMPFDPTLFQEKEIKTEENEVLPPSRFEELALKEQFLLTITDKGYGKRTSAYDYRTTLRGSQGFMNIAISEKNGNEVVASFPVDRDDDIMLVTDQGQVIRCPVSDIRIAGRRTQGVIVFRVGTGEKVVGVSRIKRDTSVEETIKKS